MRLIRSKIYRAFPELDRFGDDQCVRFVIAANSSWFGRAVRWTVVGTLGVIAMLAGAMLAALTVTRFEESDGPLAMLLGGLVLIGATLGGMVGALVARDGLLRRRVRRMIAECGSCARCRYSLLGVRVGEDLRAICPECGTPREVDAAIGELATDERGGRVFVPQGSRVDTLERERLRVRRRRLFRRVLIGGGAIAGVAGLIVGGIAGFLFVQARAASEHADMAAAWHEIRRVRGATPGAMPEAEREREWTTFVALLGPVMDIQTSVVEDPTIGMGLSNAWPDPEALRDDAASRLDGSWGAGAAVKIRKMVMETVARNAKMGNGQRQEALRALRSPARAVVLDPTGAWLAPDQIAITQCYALVNLDVARAMLAMRAADRSEHGQAMDELVELARILDAQDTVMDLVAAARIRSMVAKLTIEQARDCRDEGWLKEARARLDALGEGPDASGVFETWKTLDNTHIARFFTDMRRSGLAMVGVLPDEYAYLTRTSPVGVFQIGTYWSNAQAGVRGHDELIAQARQEPWQRTRTGPSSTGKPLVDWMQVWSGNVISQRDQMVREMRRARIGLAAAEFEARNGRAAKDVGELTGMLPSERTAWDPFTNKRFELRSSDGDKGEVVAPSDGKPNATTK